MSSNTVYVYGAKCNNCKQILWFDQQKSYVDFPNWATDTECRRCESKPIWKPIHEPQKIRKKEIYINKYRGNESLIVGDVSKFVTLPLPHIKEGNGGLKPVYSTSVDGGNITYLPNGNKDTITPLSYMFESEEEFIKYLSMAAKESFHSLYLTIDKVYRKYVNVEEHYYPILVGDTIWSYFQDRFGTTHYLIFTGDNGSGKNSALLVFRYLGYRVFYVVSASAANYYTALGSREEGQVCIAEDEADDIGKDKDKRNVLKSGYNSGGSVPKVELEGGRSQDNWLVYCLKWLAMEELKEDKNTKGIIDRSLKLRFVPGDVDYNIKDVLQSGDDPEYQKLYNELIHIRKLLFCFRLIHRNDPIPQIRLNVKGREAELVKPLIRLFRNSPEAREKIIGSLSMFIQERNESRNDSFESKLLGSIQSLIGARKSRKGENQNQIEEDKTLGDYTFTNECIRNKLIVDTEAEEDPEKKGMYYSPLVGSFGQAKITSVLKSKFKPKLPISKKIGDKTYRCVEFNQDYLNRLKGSYTTEKWIRILDKSVTPVTPVTAFGGFDADNLSVKSSVNEAKKETDNPPIGVTAVTAVTCQTCGETLDSDRYYAKLHKCK